MPLLYAIPHLTCAFKLGFADERGDAAAALEQKEAAIKAQLQQCAPGAVADSKALILALNGVTDTNQVIDIAANNFADRVQSSEALEGISSFFEKRSPAWAPSDT